MQQREPERRQVTSNATERTREETGTSSKKREPGGDRLHVMNRENQRGDRLQVSR